MGNLESAINALLQLLKQFAVATAALLTELELWLRGQLRQLGVPHSIQTVILIAVAAFLVVGAVRLFGGLIRVAVVLILILLAIHLVLPISQG